jgi:serine/threonine-protein kinase
VVLLLSWVFGSDHGFDARELNQFVAATGEALFRSVVVGLLYLAIEPFIRQRWPHALIPWNRVLEGSFSDPLVGRAAMIGILFAAVNALLRNSLLLANVMSPVLPETDLLNAMLSNSSSISFLLALVSDSVSVPLGLFALFSTFRILLRNQWVAGIVLTFIINAYVNWKFPEFTGLIVAVFFSTLWLVGVMRFGLIAGMTMWFADRVFRAWSMLAPGDWYSTRLYFFLGAVVALSVYAFTTSLGRQPMVPPELLGGRSAERA